MRDAEQRSGVARPLDSPHPRNQDSQGAMTARQRESGTTAQRRAARTARPYRGVLAALALIALAGAASAGPEDPVATPLPATPLPATDDLDIARAQVEYHGDLDLLVFSQEVRGKAGGTIPKKHGRMDGAPVIAYVFATTLRPEAIGFPPSDGIVALAVTAHPDFDDTPLWDENNDGNPGDDGAVWHTHWLVLVPDKRVPGSLSVKPFAKENRSGTAPMTVPELPIDLDSPGFAVVTEGDRIAVLVPAQRVGHTTDFRFDAITAYLQISTAPGAPMLGVYKIYDDFLGDLRLTSPVKHGEQAR